METVVQGRFSVVHDAISDGHGDGITADADAFFHHIGLPMSAAQGWLSSLLTVLREVFLEPDDDGHTGSSVDTERACLAKGPESLEAECTDHSMAIERGTRSEPHFELLGTSRPATGMSQEGARADICHFRVQPENDLYSLEFLWDWFHGFYVIICHLHPSCAWPLGMHAHLHPDNRICVTEGSEPQTATRAKVIACVWMYGFSRYRRTGVFPNDAFRVDIAEL